MTLLDPSCLFRPQSVAIFGASARKGRPGHDIIAALGLLGSTPRIYPVTPRYETILGHPCFVDATAVPEPVDLAIIASGPSRIMSDAASALAAGARSLHVLGDLVPEECDKLGEQARAAGADLLGPNSIGYVNYVDRTLSTWVKPPESHRDTGGIALVLQSGALISYANEIDPRLRFSLTIQPGREAGVTVSDALLYAIKLPTTRVAGLYLETVADPKGLVSALESAQVRDIPVVVVSPGRSPAAAKAITTHARRLAGGTAALESVFRRYGVIHARTLDEFWCALRVFSAGITLNKGGLAVVTDSGAQRAMTFDAASVAGVPLARFSAETETKLAAILAPDLEPRNPLDIWAGEEDLPGHTEACLRVALDDPDTAAALVLTDFGVPESDTFPTRMAEGALRTLGGGKPVLAASFATRHFYPGRILSMEADGLPVLDGLETSLAAIGHVFRRRDRQAWPVAEPLEEGKHADVAKALDALRAGDEASALALLRATGIPVVGSTIVNSLDEALTAARSLSGPAVLKTAEAILHKTEVRGVHLRLRSTAEITAAYNDLAERIGPRVLVAPMVSGRVELALGALVDPGFGPIVMVGAGGETAELLNDRRFALAPVSETEALDMLGDLRLSPLLAPHRGKPGVDRQMIARAIVGLSRLIAAFPDRIQEIDVNPLIASHDQVVAVDALIIATSQETHSYDHV